VIIGTTKDQVAQFGEIKVAFLPSSPDDRSTWMSESECSMCTRSI
jgi:hypothetical protein